MKRYSHKKDSRSGNRYLYLLRLFVTLLLIFVTQKVVFMLVNSSMTNGAPFSQCLLSLWHGLHLDIVTACYLMVIPIIIVLIGCFFRRFPLRKVMMPYYIIVSVVVALIFLADTILYLFWGSKLDAADLIYASKPKDMLASLPFWAILLAIILLIAIIIHYARRLRHATPSFTDAPRSPLSALWTLPLAALVVLGMRGSLSESTANPSYAYFSSYQFCNHAALNPTFNMLHSLLKTNNIDNEFAILDADEVNASLGNSYLHDSHITDTLLNTTRPNILFVVWEGGGKGIMLSDSVSPNYMALKEEGIYFSNCYANNFRTDRGLVSLLSGWNGTPTMSLMKRSDISMRLPSIAKSIKSAGYNTTFAYGGDADFTNMRLYLHETGYDTVFGVEHYPASYNQSAWGVPDHLVLDSTLITHPYPFFSTVLTLSSHEPWQVPMRRLYEDKRNSFAYTDSCIGSLVHHLRQSPLWDSLLIIIVPDHGIPFDDATLTTDPRTSEIPMLWLGGAIRKPMVVDRIISQSDIAATLLSQLSLPSDNFPFSRNIFSPQYPVQPHFAIHCFKNGANLISDSNIVSYDCVSHTCSANADTNSRTFLISLLQHTYHTTALLLQEPTQYR